VRGTPYWGSYVRQRVFESDKSFVRQTEVACNTLEKQAPWGGKNCALPDFRFGIHYLQRTMTDRLFQQSNSWQSLKNSVRGAAKISIKEVHRIGKFPDMRSRTVGLQSSYMKSGKFKCRGKWSPSLHIPAS